MINIFYKLDYIKTQKVLITKSFKHSIFYNIYLDYLNLFNLPINVNLISSGPHKRMNNLVKTFKGNKEYAFNKIKFKNNYIVQFDEFGENILNKIISKNSESKILVGPLYNKEYDKKLVDYINKYPNVKKVVASKIAFKNAVYEMGHNIDPKRVVTFPSGIIDEDTLNRHLKYKNRKNKCLIYFKKRPIGDLEKVTNFLNDKNIDYEVFHYGQYANKDLIRFALNSKFGIFMSRPETQGFAAQELLSCNIPLIVWDQKTNYYEDLILSGTTMSYWSNDCGLIVDTFEELKFQFDVFIENLHKFQPINLIKEHLTYEKFKKNLKYEFEHF